VSHFLDSLRAELEGAARRKARPRRSQLSRRALVLALGAVLALIAVPAAAVTGVFSSSPPQSSQPGVVDVGPHCVDNREPQLDTTTDPPPDELTSLLGVLRRPQRPGDRIPGDERALARLPLQGVNLEYIRRARASDPPIYLVPAENVRYFRPPPDTPGCEGLQPPELKPQPGVCLLEQAPEGAGTCAPVSAIRTGRTLLTSGARRLTHAAGIAPDGIKSIIWRVRRGTGFLDTKVPVRNNVYAGDLPSRAGHGIYVYWVTADGHRKLVLGPHHLTKRERALARRENARDRAAGPKPSIFPPSGTAKTIFTVRMRIQRPGRAVYVAMWLAPKGTACASYPRNRIGMLPATKGEQKGLIKGAFAPPPQTNWCPGTYTGTVRKAKRGRRSPAGPVIGRFTFTVR
jgi:hypothetical protein